ncbi:MAG: molybdopterin molybdotransferase MoeA [Chloroflexi bacterium]|nr:molybdopterin molybdotransferase MoeA [Chloroflexota bacterium]MDA1228836.1 molybdopterin molybdotransferase MoeA [Chloroflexota bacterium]
MLSVEEALERILSFVHVLETEEKPLLEALGQVLAEDAVSQHSIPPLDNSAMDGYALQAADVVGASKDKPVKLKVIGLVAAGQLPTEKVIPGTAVRIMTGAPVPDGADAVVPFEDTDELDRRALGGEITEVEIRFEVAKGADIRPAGQDVQPGTVVLAKGSSIRPPEVGVLASLGFATVKVVRRPVVAILATGNELLEPGEAHGSGKIFNSNSFSVAASVLRYGGVPKLLGIARDDLDSMNAKLQEGLDADILITSAGVSKGDYDMVKDVLSQHGKIDFWSVRMRPAKPLAFGVLDAPDGRKVPHLGLPGNPVSAMVAFEQFGRAAIHKMMGRIQLGKPTIRAVLDEPIYNNDGRRVYARAIITRQNGTYHVKLTGDQGSNLLTSMARANGLAICPEGIPKMGTGEVVEVQMLDWPEDVF